VKSIGTLLERILAHYEKKEYENAEKLADELIAAHPDFHRGHFLKAVILEETGRATEAENHYAKAGNRFTLWSRLALQLHDVDPQRALRYYERVSRMDPQNNLIWFSMGALYEKQGRVDEARACYRNLAPLREVLSKIVIPLGFLIIMISGAVMMIKRGDKVLASFLIASSLMCILWLRRDGVKAVRMLAKKKQYK
jgi:tetratricopeptide (TPR) repeat protein